MINNLIKKSYSNIFDKLYSITNGNIILGGSLSLKFQNIIQRDAQDLDVTILIEDWELYKSEINKQFRVYPTIKIVYDILKYDVYTCFDKETKLNEFHLFVNHSNDIFDVIGSVRVLKPEYHLIDKQMIYDSGQDIEKHLSDIHMIKTHINEK